MIAYRNMEDRDRDFVISSWSTSFKASFAAGMIYTEDWPDVMHKQIERVLARPDARTVIAYERKAREFIYGFACGDVSADAGFLDPNERKRPAPVLFYVYVKSSYRRQGIAKGLVAELGIDTSKAFLYACKTEIVTRVFRPKIPLGQWDPVVPRFPKPPRPGQ